MRPAARLPCRGDRAPTTGSIDPGKPSARIGDPDREIGSAGGELVDHHHGGGEPIGSGRIDEDLRARAGEAQACTVRGHRDRRDGARREHRPQSVRSRAVALPRCVRDHGDFTVAGRGLVGHHHDQLIALYLRDHVTTLRERMTPGHWSGHHAGHHDGRKQLVAAPVERARAPSAARRPRSGAGEPEGRAFGVAPARGGRAHNYSAPGKAANASRRSGNGAARGTVLRDSGGCGELQPPPSMSTQIGLVIA